MEDVCLVCAEALQYSAYGPCGHTETCSKCVCRLRALMQDTRCVLCQQESESVFVTRFLGTFTRMLAADEWTALKTQASSGALQYLPSASAYFDDPQHFASLSQLVTFSHPAMPDPSQIFPSLKALRGTLKSARNLHLCDLCLQGRKVFLCEQLAYTRPELDAHVSKGDSQGPLATAGFSGHPRCQFCERRFYGETEIFQHMTQQHESCFLCRRVDPHRHVYYADYPELERHFFEDHHACTHPACLERKFVVFPTAQDLRLHFAKEHPDGLSKGERRAARTLEVPVQSYRPPDGGGRGGRGGRAGGGRRGPEAPAGPSSASPAPLLSERELRALAVASSGAGGVVIGGGGTGGRRPQPHAQPRLFQQGQQRPDTASEAAQTALALRLSQAASLEQAGASGAGSARTGGPGLRVNDVDFPSVGEAYAGGGGNAGGTRWAGTMGGGSGGPLRAEDFPSLPAASRAERRREKASEQERKALYGAPGLRQSASTGSNLHAQGFHEPSRAGPSLRPGLAAAGPPLRSGPTVAGPSSRSGPTVGAPLARPASSQALAPAPAAAPLRPASAGADSFRPTPVAAPKKTAEAFPSLSALEAHSPRRAARERVAQTHVPRRAQAAGAPAAPRPAEAPEAQGLRPLSRGEEESLEDMLRGVRAPRNARPKSAGDGVAEESAPSPARAAAAARAAARALEKAISKDLALAQAAQAAVKPSAATQRAVPEAPRAASGSDSWPALPAAPKRAVTRPPPTAGLVVEAGAGPSAPAASAPRASGQPSPPVPSVASEEAFPSLPASRKGKAPAEKKGAAPAKPLFEAAGAQPRGKWAAAGKLAQKQRAMNEAWSAPSNR